jgi:hypothetical protein
MAEPSLRAPVALPVRPDSATADFVQEAQHTLFDFQGVSSKSAGNVRLKASVNKATLHQYTQRQAVMPGLPDAEGLRTLAGEIKQHAIENLDYYLEQLKANVEEKWGAGAFRGDGGRCAADHHGDRRADEVEDGREVEVDGQ